MNTFEQLTKHIELFCYPMAEVVHKAIMSRYSTTGVRPEVVLMSPADVYELEDELKHYRMIRYPYPDNKLIFDGCEILQCIDMEHMNPRAF